MERNIELENNFKSHINFYWYSFITFIFLVLSISYFFVKESKNFSFEFYFLMMIPLWVGVLSANGYESKRVKDFFRDYLSKYYSQKLQDYDQKPVDLLNSDTEDILDLFSDKELISDPIIENLSKESKKITNFMYSVFLIMPILLVVTYFVILK